MRRDVAERMRMAKKYLPCDGTKPHGKEWRHGKE
jgi:hypothetical protein